MIGVAVLVCYYLKNPAPVPLSSNSKPDYELNIGTPEFSLITNISETELRVSYNSLLLLGLIINELVIDVFYILSTLVIALSSYPRLTASNAPNPSSTFSIL